MENELSLVLLALVGVVIQAVFKYFPKISVWYDAQEGKKKVIMILAVAAVSLVYFGLGCTQFAGQLGIQVACSVTGFLDLGTAFVVILVSQQATYALSR